MEMVKTRELTHAEKDVILKNEFSITCRVGSTGVTADANGEKWILAGTPVGHSTKKLTEDGTAVAIVTNTSSTGANAQGVLWHDVNVTDGEVVTSVLIRGVVDSNKCPTIDSTAKEALADIQFVNGGR